MSIAWRYSADAFAEILQRFGLQPDAVTNVEAAWQAFQDFVQVEVDGLAPDPDADRDGFIVQWGRCYANSELASLSFTRQLAIAGPRDLDGLEGHSGFWQLDPRISFDDSCDPIDFDGLDTANTDFYFDPIGSQRAEALMKIRGYVDHQPLLRGIWHMTPASSELTFSAV
jgi:hypothetical protein